MRLVLRADGNSQIGLGHVMRCLALGQAWQDDGGEVTLVTHALPAALTSRLLRERFTLAELPRDVETGSADDAAETAAQAGVYFVDGYHFGADFIEALKAHGVVGQLDDHSHQPRYAADVLVNQNAGAADAMYAGKLDGAPTVLLGPRHALLRREHASRRDEPRPALQSPVRVLVTMGGADANNVSATIARALGRARPGELEVRVLVGAANPHRAELAALPGIEIRPPTSDIASEQIWANVAITGAGSTCWELACLGVPAITVVLADNQQIVAAGMAAAGAGIDLGWYTSLDETKVLDVVRAVTLDADRMQAMTDAGRALVDGRGAARVVDALKACNRPSP